MTEPHEKRGRPAKAAPKVSESFSTYQGTARNLQVEAQIGKGYAA
jgi:hypothetical protein